jgi:hypothetical protein
MAVPAASPQPVRTAGALPVGMAGQHQAPLRLARVDPPEAGRGEGHEQPRMLADAVRDALAALQPSGQELVGISPVDGRTRRAARLPAGTARLQQHPIRLPTRVVDLPDLAGCPVGVLDPTGQADGVVAVAGLGHQAHPTVIALAGPVHHLGQHPRQDLAHPNRARHATSPGAGISGTTRSPGAAPASSSAGSIRSPAVARIMAATWW